MPDLKELFDDAVAHAPAETHSPADIVRAARRDHTRRTTAVIGGLVAAVVAIAGLGYGLSREVSTAPPTPGPAYQPPAGALPLADALPAEPRVDYNDQLMVTSDDTTVQRFTSHTNDGGVVLMKITDGSYSFSVVGGNADVAELTPPPGRTPGATMMPLTVDSSWEVWGDPAARELDLSVRDVASGEWFDVTGTLDGLPAGATVDDIYLIRAKLYVIASDLSARRAMIYAARLRPGATLETDLPGAAIAVGSGGGKVAWVPVARPDAVEVIDHDFDEPATLPLELDPGCEVAPRNSLATNSYLIAAWVQCDGGRAAVVRTFLGDGKSQATVAGWGVAGIDLMEGALVIDASDGVYLLRRGDQAQDRLVRRDGITAVDGIDAWAGAFIWNEAPDGTGPSRVVAVP
ncbi:hypothetical protein [Nocardioides sp. InS609-2]|uniref:hypothetical protein n=1 Tax=Nocardioides sp. InS609-2 TaxID=2760705 RepID=UPI0020C0A646|nr:hypothetical protein [Nocardioides sp. InS609-2]